MQERSSSVQTVWEMSAGPADQPIVHQDLLCLQPCDPQAPGAPAALGGASATCPRSLPEVVPEGQHLKPWAGHQEVVLAQEESLIGSASQRQAVQSLAAEAGERCSLSAQRVLASSSFAAAHALGLKS